MARIVDHRLMASGSARRLTPTDRKRATRRLASAESKNPLRRIRLACHGWVRDPSAVVGDWVWCTSCDDVREVVELAE